MWHLRDIVPLFKDMHNEKIYRRLSKLLARVLRLKEDTDLKKAHLNWILFSLAYVGDALNTGKSISRMREALPNLLISNEEDSNNLENLINYFDKFDEHEGIKEIYNAHVKGKLPELEEKCLDLLEEKFPDFVKEQREEKASTDNESEGT